MSVAFLLCHYLARLTALMHWATGEGSRSSSQGTRVGYLPLTPNLASHRHLCRPCHNREKAKGLGKYICQRCHQVMDEQPLMFKNDAYHPDHFNCTNCGYSEGV